VKRGSGGTIRAYDLVSSHHALRAWHIICFENRFELGTINTQFAFFVCFVVVFNEESSVIKNEKGETDGEIGEKDICGRRVFENHHGQDS